MEEVPIIFEMRLLLSHFYVEFESPPKKKKKKHGKSFAHPNETIAGMKVKLIMETHLDELFQDNCLKNGILMLSDEYLCSEIVLDFFFFKNGNGS